MGLVTALFPGLGGFTRYNLYAVGLSLLFDLPDLYATLFCTLWYVTRHARKKRPSPHPSCACVLSRGILLSFNAAGLMDRSAFPRFAAAKGLSMLQFHIMNVTLHFVPCLLTVWNPPDAVLWWHGLVAVCFHVGWGYWVSGGSMKLDRVYVHMDVSFWRLIWASAVIGEALLSPFVVHPLLVGP